MNFYPDWVISALFVCSVRTFALLQAGPVLTESEPKI